MKLYISMDMLVLLLFHSRYRIINWVGNLPSLFIALPTQEYSSSLCSRFFCEYLHNTHTYCHHKQHSRVSYGNHRLSLDTETANKNKYLIWYVIITKLEYEKKIGIVVSAFECVVMLFRFRPNDTSRESVVYHFQ